MYQKLIIVGNLGGDPEMRYMPDGTAVTNFSVATSERWTDKGTGEKTEKTTWIRVSAWGKQGESCNQYLTRGSKVLVEGKLQSDPATGSPRIWTRQDGTAGASFEMKADRVQFLSSKDEAVSEAAGAGTTAVSEEEDIPF